MPPVTDLLRTGDLVALDHSQSLVFEGRDTLQRGSEPLLQDLHLVLVRVGHSGGFEEANKGSDRVFGVSRECPALSVTQMQS